ncbi:MAG: ATPase, T2SS/T4P/T4SS family [Verrucomicrobiota bacterium]|nr:ATPase, T2SS/T4P/T4SS family [Verrucomicrobiota bacterium]
MAENGKSLELLSNIDIFSRLDQKDLAALAKIARTESHKAGKVVFRQGDPSENFLVVSNGTFECYLWDDILKIERPLTIFKRGDIFGEMGLLTNESRSAFVRARQDAETVCVPKEAFLEMLEKEPQMVLQLAKMLAHRLNAANKARGVKLEQISNFKINRELLQLLPLQVILRHKVLPVAKEEGHITIAIVDPSDHVARNTVSEFLAKQHLLWVCVSQPDFEHFRDRKLFDMLNENATSPIEEPAELVYLSSNQNPAAPEASSAVAQLLDEILVKAFDASASDLHFEPAVTGVAVRARIDGRLVELVPPLTLQNYKPLVSRLKVLAEMDITETRLPQDAVMRLRYGSRNIDVRISTVPSPRGESVACRLFDPQQRKLDLKNLVISEPVAEIIRKLFLLQSGLVLVTGPTGSGKTTTLYAGIQERQRQNPTSKLVTAEDPIEYELPGATQIQVNPAIGLTFERILRSTLRQDPDIILIGEIRDKASMEIALEAALTGHLVLSSIHTNDAFETVVRLRQRGFEPFAIASALRGVITQRLVPRLCGACAEPAEADPQRLAQLRQTGIIEAGQICQLWHGKGCTHCRMTGRRGRLSLYEALVVTPELRDAIEREATLSEMIQTARPENYISMRRYARLALEKGLVDAKDLLEALPSTQENRA